MSFSQQSPPCTPTRSKRTLARITPAIFNNIGVDEIVHGNIPSAINYFARGLEKYKRCSKEDRKQHSSRRTSSSLSSCITIANNEYDLIDCWMARQSKSALSLFDGDVNNDDGVYFYNEPIRVPMPLPAREVLVRDDFDCFSYPAIRTAVVLTFNIGLCYQLLATREGGSFSSSPPASGYRETMLRRSLSFFENALRLQRTQYSRASESPLFFMAVINNVGILARALGMHQTASGCFHQLLSLLMYVSTTSTSGHYQQVVVSHHQWQGYFHNASSSQPRTSKQSIAAAA
jgi:hypothetical protein